MKYNKLIRDKIPEIIQANGREPIIHIANQQEYWQKLKEKLIEEFKEFEADESPEELADVLEVIDAIIEYKGFDFVEIKKIKEQKAQKHGEGSKNE